MHVQSTEKKVSYYSSPLGRSMYILCFEFTNSTCMQQSDIRTIAGDGNITICEGNTNSKSISAFRSFLRDGKHL